MARVKINTYSAQRIADRLRGAPPVLLDEAEKQLQKAGDKVAKTWSDAIASSGRGGGQWNAQMSNVQAKVTQPSSGGFFLRIGWLDGGPAPAGGGASTWFIYHDTGYRFYGTSHWVSGLGQFLARRAEMLDEADKITARVEARLVQYIKG